MIKVLPEGQNSLRPFRIQTKSYVVIAVAYMEPYNNEVVVG